MTSGGLGTKKRTISPMETEMIKGMIFAPCKVTFFSSVVEGALSLVEAWGEESFL